MSSQRALASQHNTQFGVRLTCTDTRRSTMSSQRALASQHNTRDGQTPRSHTQCPPYNLCSATSRDRFLSTPAVLSTLPAAFAPFARALRARPSPLFPRGAFLGAVPLGPLEQTPQHQPAVEAECWCFSMHLSRNFSMPYYTWPSFHVTKHE